MTGVRLLLGGVLAFLAWRALDGARAGTSGHLGMVSGVLAFLAGMVSLGWKRFSGVRGRPGGSRRIICVAAWLGLVVIGLFWVVVVIRGPVQEVILLWERAFDTPPAPQTSGEGTQAQTTGHLDWNEGSKRALPRQTNIKPGNKPEAFLRVEDRVEAQRLSKAPIYLSSIAYDRYEDSAWHIASELPGELRPDAAGVIMLEKQARGEGIWHTIVMSSDARRRLPLVALQGVSRVEGLKGLERWSGALHLLPQPEEPHQGYRYRANSRPMALKDIAGTDRCELDGTHDPDWLRIPQDALGRRIAELAQSVAAGDSLPERARKIQSHLRDQYRYSLSTANPRNLEPLENFLFGEKSGHCEYFATAGAIMARSVGIPSRVMYGWAGGTWYEHADWFVFRADEAHVWVELWMGRHGWVVMDPTPPEALRSRANNRSKEQLPAMPGTVEEETHEGEPDVAAGPLPWFASVLVVAAGLAVLMRSSRRTTDGGDKGVIPEPWREHRVADYLEAWKTAARTRLSRYPARSTTLRQQLRTMHPTPEFAEDLLGYHYQVRYEGRPRDRAREKILTRRIRAWAAQPKE